MKKLVESVDGERLERFLGERILLLCANYFYEGKLVGINETCVLLDDAGIVYETGQWSTPTYTDRQSLPSAWYVQLSMIESFGASKSKA